MRLKFMGWVGVIWGTFILVTGTVRALTEPAHQGVYAAGQLFAFAIGVLLLVAGVKAVKAKRMGFKLDPLEEFARDYTAAWCSQNPARVAAHFAERGALTINGGPPSIGREAIAEAARGFMTAFPDMVVTMDKLDREDGTEYHWTLTGTNTGPGGTGRSVRISGYEEWLIGADGLIVDSQGHFDQDEYERQLRA